MKSAGSSAFGTTFELEGISEILGSSRGLNRDSNLPVSPYQVIPGPGPSAPAQRCFHYMLLGAVEEVFSPIASWDIAISSNGDAVEVNNNICGGFLIH